MSNATIDRTVAVISSPAVTSPVAHRDTVHTFGWVVGAISSLMRPFGENVAMEATLALMWGNDEHPLAILAYAEETLVAAYALRADEALAIARAAEGFDAYNAHNLGGTNSSIDSLLAEAAAHFSNEKFGDAIRTYNTLYQSCGNLTRAVRAFHTETRMRAENEAAAALRARKARKKVNNRANRQRKDDENRARAQARH